MRLRLRGEVAAFFVRPRDLSHICQYIERLGDPCVALRVPTAETRIRIAVLVDARDHVADLAPLPPGVTRVPAGAVLPLPPSVTPDGTASWLIRPDMKRRWLPNATTLLAAVRPSVRRTSRRVEPRDRVLIAAEGPGQST